MYKQVSNCFASASNLSVPKSQQFERNRKLCFSSNIYMLFNTNRPDVGSTTSRKAHSQKYQLLIVSPDRSSKQTAKCLATLKGLFLFTIAEEQINFRLDKK